MFFVKALGGSMVVVFGGFWAFGAFDNEAATLAAVETVRKAEIADNKTARWGPHCNALRDKLFGMQDGMPVGAMSANPLEAIGKVNHAAAELEKAGCDPDAAPGAFSPFEPDKGEFREVTTRMGNAPSQPSPRGRSRQAPGTAPVVHEDGGWGKLQ